MFFFFDNRHAVVITNKEDDVKKIVMRDNHMVVNHEASNSENLLRMEVHSEDEACKLTIMPRELGFVLGKINLDVQRIVYVNKSTCVQKKDFNEKVTFLK